MGGNRFPTQSLLWPFDEQEQKFAPHELFLAGDPDLLRAAACVAIVGSREASTEGGRSIRVKHAESGLHQPGGRPGWDDLGLANGTSFRPNL